MKKFILAMASLSLLAGCGDHWIINLSEETVKVNGIEMEDTCEEVSYIFWGLFADWPVEIKVGARDSKTWDERDNYTVHADGEVKKATKEDLKQCKEEGGDKDIKPAIEAATAATADLNTKVEAYKAAKQATATEIANTGANNPPAKASQEAEATALTAAKAAAKAAADAATAAREAAGQDEVGEEDKTAAEAAATEAEQAIEAAKAAGVQTVQEEE